MISFDYWVHVGNNNRFLSNETREKLYTVKNIILHDYYVGSTLNDIAIIVLNEPLKMQKGVIEKVRLPERSLSDPKLPSIISLFSI